MLSTKVPVPRLSLLLLVLLYVPDSPAQVCRDKSPGCGTVASLCRTNNRIRSQCEKTCKICVETEVVEDLQVCEDSNPGCARVSAQCQWSARVRSQCKKTCNLCVEKEVDENKDLEVCEDTNPGCTRVAAQCQWSDRVRSQCKKTCNLCVEKEVDEDAEVCRDASARCNRVASQCLTDKRVQSQCKKTCNLCVEKEIDKDEDAEICKDTSPRCEGLSFLCSTDERVQSQCKKTCNLCVENEVDENEESPQFSKWTEFGQCSDKCGGGIHSRTRQCLTESCTGHKEEIQNCNEEECPRRTCVDSNRGCRQRKRRGLCNFESIAKSCPKTCEAKGCGDDREEPPWEEYGPCSVACGVGLKTRFKGSIAQSITCFEDECQEAVVTANWGSWSEDASCSDTCGGGTWKRVRVCSEPDQCAGERETTLPCQTQPCPSEKDPEWGYWSAWTICSMSCNGGLRQRKRKCETPVCIGEATEEETCNVEACPDPEWGYWSVWTICSMSCNGGLRQRKRKCETPVCIGEATEEETCNVDACSDPEWGYWSAWTKCSMPCNGGLRQRKRTCETPVCVGEATEEEKCNVDACPEWAEWSKWSNCTFACGGGQALRVRTCTVAGRCTELPGPRQEVKDCNTELCPIWGEWSGWEKCSATCGGGERKRTRSCQVEGECQELSGETEETEECNPNTCPVWTAWSFWSRCSSECGEGTRTRSRFCSIEGLCDNLPEGKEQTGYCNVEACATWFDWSSWSPCTFTCGGGRRLRARTCSIEGRCGDEIQQGEDCNMQPCPEWSAWSNWGDCSKTCEEGERTKTRSCSIPSQCKGDSEESEKCTIKKICDDDGNWSKCSRSCGGGTRKRYHCIEERKNCTWNFEPCAGGDCPDALCSFIPSLAQKYGVNHVCCPVKHVPSEEKCGRTATEKRIIGGVAAKAEQWPWMIAVHITQGGFCAGVLISKNFVLSAAHCFAYDSGKPKDTTGWKIFVGILKLSESGVFPDLAIPIKNTYIYPNYNFPNFDIALVELQNDVSFTSTIQPICLPWGEETPQDTTCIVAGWGVSNVTDSTTNHLQELAILNYDPLVCLEAYGKHKDLEYYVDFLKENKGYMCAGSLTKLIDSCSGDSGGPLMCQRCNSCTWYVAGIVSFGPNPCARRAVPGVYSKVVHFEEWILKTTGMSKYSLSCNNP